MEGFLDHTSSNNHSPDKTNSSNFADSMPSNERVDQLLDIPELPSLDAFLGIFDTPVDIIMESERVWPPERQQPY